MRTFSLNPDPAEFWGSLTREVVEKVNPEWLTEMSMQIIERRGSLGENYEFFTSFGEEANRQKIVELNAFAAMCERNSTFNKAKHEVEVVEEMDKEAGSTSHAVFSSVYSYVEQNYETIANDSALEVGLKQLIEIRDYIRLEKQVDLFTLIKVAYQGVMGENCRAEKAAKTIRELCTEFNFTEKFMEIMGLPTALESIFAMA